MARIKAAKIVPCQTRAEFEETVDAIAKMAIQKEKLEVALKQRHQQLDDKYGAEIKTVERDIQEAYGRAEPYFEDHAGELCDPVATVPPITGLQVVGGHAWATR